MNPLRTAVEMTFRCVARWRHGRAVHAQGVELDAELTLEADSLWGSRSRLRARTCDFKAARSYSLISPPSTDRRLNRCQSRRGAG